MKTRPVVIKIGGSTFGGEDTTVNDLVELQGRGVPLVVVHGGGAMVTEWLKKQGVATVFAHGLRVTDSESLKVVVAVLAGLVNKELVGSIQRAGGKAVGLSGVDGAMLSARVADKKLGYVGDVTAVDVHLLEMTLEAGFIAVIAPVSRNVARGNKSPPILNVNGDTATAEIAVALSADKLIFLTDVAGVYDKSGKVLPRLTPVEAEELIAAGVAAGGMEVKIRGCLKAMSRVKAAKIVDGRKPHALLDALDGKGQGTTIGV